MNNPLPAFDTGFRWITLTALAGYFKSAPVHRSRFVVSFDTFLSCFASCFESELFYYCTAYSTICILIQSVIFANYYTTLSATCSPYPNSALTTSCVLPSAYTRRTSSITQVCSRNAAKADNSDFNGQIVEALL